MLQIINKLMNFFLNHALISLNTAPTPQNIFLMIKEKHILIIQKVSYKSSSKSPSVQVLCQQIRGGGGSRLALTMLGGPKSGETSDIIFEYSLIRNKDGGYHDHYYDVLVNIYKQA